MHIGQKIKEYRESLEISGKKVSRNQLGKLSGVGQSTISDIEAGNRSPTLDTLQKICSALGVEVTYFFDSDPLPSDLIKWLNLGRQLPREQRQILIQLAQNLVELKEGKSDE